MYIIQLISLIFFYKYKVYITNIKMMKPFIFCALSIFKKITQILIFLNITIINVYELKTEKYKIIVFG